MYPPIFPVCAASVGVTALLGSNPTRLFWFGEAPHRVALPYAVWQVVSGVPENNLNDRPTTDSYTLQVDVYADTGSAAAEVAEALRDAIEGHAYITRWGGQEIDPNTKHRRIGFDVDWYVQRPVS